jgi:Ca-activated chloride channel family protein
MSVWYYNQGNPTGDPTLAGKHARPKTPLVAIYPKEGTLVSDHPYVTLGNSDKKAAAADFLKYLRSDKVQKRFQQDAFRSYDNKPSTLTTQANGLLPDQPKKMIAPPAPPVLDKVLKSWGALRKKSNVLFVVDVSGSMNEPVAGTGKSKMDLLKASLGKAMDGFIDVDRVGLWEFATKLQGALPYRELAPMAPLSNPGQRQRLKSQVAGLKAISDTGLYLTARDAFQQVKTHLEPGAINSVVLLTDGHEDNPSGGSHINLDALLTKLDSASGVRVFTVAFGQTADKGVLKQIAAKTDAASYDASDAAALGKVFAAVTSNF